METRNYAKDTVGAHAVFVTTGASNHAIGEREENDYYATDPVALEMLLELETFDKNIWECACGAGHLSKVLEERGYNVKSTDMFNHGYGEIGVDFLDFNEKFDGDIITNPPYRMGAEFVKKALDVVDDGHRVAMFLRLQFLEGKSRRELFDTYPPKIVYVSSSRLNCCKNGDFSKERRNNSSAVAYAWFIWEKGYAGDTIIKWFN